MKHKNLISWMITLILVPITLILGSKLPGRWYYLTSTLIILELLIPFFLAFEGRKPQARELVLICVLCALAVAARVAIPVPSFKAIFAVIMVAGMALGSETGFLVGSVAALASNFFYSQGPYTPWQMMAYGVGGWTMGFLFQKNRLPRKSWIMGIAGFCVTLVLVGPLLDSCTIFLAPITISWKNIMAIYLAGLPMNLTQSASTGVCLFLLGKPLLDKIQRIIRKYGMVENF